MTTITADKLTGFAAACYDQNTIADLIVALRSPVDRRDCDTWKLGDDEYRDALADALMARIVHRDRLPAEQ